MTEEWRDIEGYEGWYQISNIGRVKSLKRRNNSHGNNSIIEKERILKQHIHGKGYLCVRLAPICNGYKKKSFDIHRLVAMNFLPNPNNKPQVDHINRIKTDNRVENLRWVDNSENQQNSESNVNITAFGKTQCITKWSKEFGLSTSCIKQRINKGFIPELALTIPPTNNSTRTQIFRKKEM